MQTPTQTSTLPTPIPEQPEFSIAQARHLVKDLFHAKPKIYWSDFLLSLGIGSFCFVAVENSAMPDRLVDVICQWLGWSMAGHWTIVAVLFLVQCLAFYRAALFTHELTHLRDGAVRGFNTLWNLLCGIPFLMPSFTYSTHVHHHVRKQYGTMADGEYLALADGPARNILWYLSQSFIIPVLAVIRFGLLTPLAWISPSIRRTVRQRASSMIIDPAYIRPLPTPKELRVWRLQEVACLAYVATLALLLWTGVLPWYWLLHAYLTGVFIITINAVRTLGAHHYRHHGEELTFVEQLLDSLNYPTRPLLNELWAPVGLRFHALHHLFPSLPYHSLARAHRRLMAELPADSPYRQTEAAGLLPVLQKLWRDARHNSRA